MAGTGSWPRALLLTRLSPVEVFTCEQGPECLWKLLSWGQRLLLNLPLPLTQALTSQREEEGGFIISLLPTDNVQVLLIHPENTDPQGTALHVDKQSTLETLENSGGREAS